MESKLTGSPAKIRINASIRNQPLRVSGGSQVKLADNTSSNRTSGSVGDNKKSLDRLEPYLKVSTPIRPLKNFTSTVSYLRPATENKAIAPVESQK